MEVLPPKKAKNTVWEMQYSRDKTCNQKSDVESDLPMDWLFNLDQATYSAGASAYHQ